MARPRHDAAELLVCQAVRIGVDGGQVDVARPWALGDVVTKAKGAAPNLLGGTRLGMRADRTGTSQRRSASQYATQLPRTPTAGETTFIRFLKDYAC